MTTGRSVGLTARIPGRALAPCDRELSMVAGSAVGRHGVAVSRRRRIAISSFRADRAGYYRDPSSFTGHDAVRYLQHWTPRATLYCADARTRRPSRARHDRSEGAPVPLAHRRRQRVVHRRSPPRHTTVAIAPWRRLRAVARSHDHRHARRAGDDPVRVRSSSCSHPAASFDSWSTTR